MPAISRPILQLMLCPQGIIQAAYDERDQVCAIVDRRGAGDDLMYVVMFDERPEIDEVFATLVAIAIQDWEWNPNQPPNVRVAWATTHEGTTVVVRPNHFGSQRLGRSSINSLGLGRSVSDHPIRELHWRSPMGLAQAMLSAVREERERAGSRPGAVAGRQITISITGLLQYIAESS